jgi:hypothetical protein
MRKLLDRLRRFYHDWWIADDEESKIYDERETRLLAIIREQKAEELRKKARNN